VYLSARLALSFPTAGSTSESIGSSGSSTTGFVGTESRSHPGRDGSRNGRDTERGGEAESCVFNKQSQEREKDRKRNLTKVEKCAYILLYDAPSHLVGARSLRHFDQFFPSIQSRFSRGNTHICYYTRHTRFCSYESMLECRYEYTASKERCESILLYYAWLVI